MPCRPLSYTGTAQNRVPVVEMQRTCRLLKAVDQIGYMTPARLRAATEALRDNWNSLRNQVLGRGVKPRTDLPEDFTDLVATEYGHFRRWYDSIREDMFSEMFGAYQSEYKVQLAKYQGIWQVAEMLFKKLPKRERLKASGMPEFEDKGRMHPIFLAAIVLGIGLIFWKLR